MIPIGDSMMIGIMSMFISRLSAIMMTMTVTITIMPMLVPTGKGRA